MSIVIYLFGVYDFVPNVHFPFTPLQNWTDWFSITPWGLLITGVGTVLAGLVAVLFRQGTYAIYAMLIAALGLIITPIQNIVTAIPTAIGMWLPDSTNPLPAVNGVYPTNPIILVIDLLFIFAAFWFIFGLVIQRDV